MSGQYQVPEGVERLAPDYNFEEMEPSADGDYFRVADLGKLHAAWEAEQPEEVARLERERNRFDKQAEELAADAVKAEKALAVAQKDHETALEDRDGIRSKVVGEVRWKLADLASWLSCEITDLQALALEAQKESVQIGTREQANAYQAVLERVAALERDLLASLDSYTEQPEQIDTGEPFEDGGEDAAQAAEEEFEDRFGSCDQCERPTLDADLKTIWCQEPESGEQVDARICLICRLEAAQAQPEQPKGEEGARRRWTIWRIDRGEGVEVWSGAEGPPTNPPEDSGHIGQDWIDAAQVEVMEVVPPREDHVEAITDVLSGSVSLEDDDGEPPPREHYVDLARQVVAALASQPDTPAEEERR